MKNKLYVGNLPFSATGDDLQALFAQHGTVQEATVVSDRATGRSRGFGFVTMATDEEAQKAIEALHGNDFQGRNLVVNEAKPPRPRENRDNRGFRN